MSRRIYPAWGVYDMVNNDWLDALGEWVKTVEEADRFSETQEALERGRAAAGDRSTLYIVAIQIAERSPRDISLTANLIGHLAEKVLDVAGLWEPSNPGATSGKEWLSGARIDASRAAEWLGDFMRDHQISCDMVGLDQAQAVGLDLLGEDGEPL